MCVFKGPAESLFKESYFQLMKSALKDGGILCSQGNFILHSSFVIIKCDEHFLAFSVSAEFALFHKSVLPCKKSIPSLNYIVLHNNSKLM